MGPAVRIYRFLIVTVPVLAACVAMGLLAAMMSSGHVPALFPHAAVSSGTVVHKDVETAGRNRRHYLTVQYPAWDLEGRRTTPARRFRIDRRMYNTVAVGGNISVTYSRRSPLSAVLTERGREQAALFYLALAALLAGLTLPYLAEVIRGAVLSRGLRRQWLRKQQELMASRPPPQAGDGTLPAGELAPLTPAELEAAFRGGVEPVPLPPRYKLALALATTGLLLVAGVYLGLVALAAWGLWYHITAHSLWLVNEELPLLYVLAYSLPIGVGAPLLLFLVKPMLAGRPAELEPVRLDEQRHALFLDFVARIARAVRAPMPAEIHVDCSENASASLIRRGPVPFRRRLVLTLGLPLILHFSARDLGGVIAHELAHFAQRAAMRLSLNVRLLQQWLFRAAWLDDSWDQVLHLAGEHSYLRVLLFLARPPRWLAKQLFRLLFLCAEVVSCFLLRQMEIDADRYHARLCGADSVETTCGHTSRLGIASAIADADMQIAWLERKLCDNLPALVHANLARITDEDMERMNKAVAEAGSRLLDTHPSHAARIRSARGEQGPPALRLDVPATRLLDDLLALCTEATISQYYWTLEREIQPAQLVPWREFFRHHKEMSENYRSQARVLQDIFSVQAPLALPPSQPSATPDELIAEIRHTRDAMLQAAPQARKDLQELGLRDVELIECLQKRAFAVEAKMPIQGFPTSPAGIQSAVDRAVQRRAEAVERINVFQDLAARRLIAVADLLDHSALDAPGRDRSASPPETDCDPAALASQRDRQPPDEGFGSLAGELDLAAVDTACQARLDEPLRVRLVELRRQGPPFRESLDALRRYAELCSLLLDLRNAHMCLVAVYQASVENPKIPALAAAVEPLVQSARQASQALHQAASDPTQAAVLSVLGGCQLPDDALPEGMTEHLEKVLDAVTSFYLRWLYRSAAVVEAVEDALGMDRMPEPPEENEEQKK